MAGTSPAMTALIDSIISLRLYLTVRPAPRASTPRRSSQQRNDLDAEVDERADLGGRVFARGMEGEQRKALAVPVREQVDQRAVGQKIADAPADDLSDAGAGDALREHRLGIGERQRAAGRDFDRLAVADELPLEGSPCVGVEKLQTGRPA